MKIGSLGEGAPPLFPGQTAVAKLTGVINLGEAASYLLACQLRQCIKTQMLEAGVPEPCLVVVVRCQADRPPNLQVQRVEPVVACLHLGEEVVVTVADSEHPAINKYLAASLIELANTDDVAAQAGDEVEIGEGAMLAVLALEDDRAAPLDVHT